MSQHTTQHIIHVAYWTGHSNVDYLFPLEEGMELAQQKARAACRVLLVMEVGRSEGAPARQEGYHFISLLKAKAYEEAWDYWREVTDDNPLNVHLIEVPTLNVAKPIEEAIAKWEQEYPRPEGG